MRDRRQRPYSTDTGSSWTAYEEFGSSREPSQARSTKTQSGRRRYVVDFTGVESPDVHAAKIRVGKLLAITGDRADINGVIRWIRSDLPLDDIRRFASTPQMKPRYNRCDGNQRRRSHREPRSPHCTTVLCLPKCG